MFVFIFSLGLNTIGFLLYLRVFAPYIEERNGPNSGTIHEYLSCAYSEDSRTSVARTIRLAASVITVVGLALAVVFELSLAVDLLQPPSAAQRFYDFSALATMIAVFTAYGGFRSLVVSDVINGSLVVICALCLCVIILMSSGGDAPFQMSSLSVSGIAAVGWPSILSIALIGSGWMLVAMDQWQRSCAARSYKTTAKGTLIYFFVMSFFAIVFALWGAFDASVMPHLVGKSVSLSGSINPVLDLLKYPVATSVDRAVVSFATIGLLFAAVSTTNTFLTVCSHSLTSDVLVGSFFNRGIASIKVTGSPFFVSVSRSIIVLFVSALVMLFFIFSRFEFYKIRLAFSL